MSKSRSAVCLVFLLVSLLLSSCGGSEPATPPVLIEPLTGKIETVRVTRGAVESLAILPGITRAPTEAARLETGSGIIGALYAFPGDIVTQGQLLARLDTPHLDMQIERLEESIELAITVNDLYMREISAQIRLLESFDSDGSQIRLLRLDRQYAAARYEMEMTDMEEKLADLSFQKGQTEILAPIDGEVVYTVPLGTPVSVMDAVMYIAGSGNVFVEYIGEFPVPWDVTLIQVDIGGRIYNLREKRYSLSEYMGFRNFNIEMPARFEIISGSPDTIKSGELAFIHRYTIQIEDTLRIPEQAINNDGGGTTYVYRIKNGEQEIVNVTVGAVTDVFIQILDGLDEGDEVVAVR